MELLRSSGWRTALIGKGHLQNMTDRPAAWTAGLAPGTEPLQAQASLRDGPDYAQESIAHWAQQPTHQVSLPYYGFEHVQFCLEHGDVTGGAIPSGFRSAASIQISGLAAPMRFLMLRRPCWTPGELGFRPSSIPVHSLQKRPFLG